MTGTDEIVLSLTAKGLTLGGVPLKNLTPQASLPNDVSRMPR